MQVLWVLLTNVFALWYNMLLWFRCDDKAALSRVCDDSVPWTISMWETNFRVGFADHSCGTAFTIPNIILSSNRNADVPRKNDFSPSVTDRFIDLQLLIFWFIERNELSYCVFPRNQEHCECQDQLCLTRISRQMSEPAPRQYRPSKFIELAQLDYDL